MNNVCLTGRITKDIELKRTQGNIAYASFNLAVERPQNKAGEKQTDFPKVTVFGKQAENAAKYLAKGSLIGVTGRIQTGSYQGRDGNMVYTTDVYAERIEYLEKRQEGSQKQAQKASPQRGYSEPAYDEYDDDIPF